MMTTMTAASPVRSEAVAKSKQIVVGSNTAVVMGSSMDLYGGGHVGSGWKNMAVYVDRDKWKKWRWWRQLFLEEGLINGQLDMRTVGWTDERMDEFS